MTVTEYDTNEAVNRFQNYEIDALFILRGHPSNLILNITEGSRQVNIVSASNLDPLIDSKPYYIKATILIKYYPKVKNTQDVETLGLKATFITDINMSNDIVYAFTKEIIDNHSSFKQLHPVYEVLTKKDMLKGLTAPIHPGAKKYYDEVYVSTSPATNLLLLEK